MNSDLLSKIDAIGLQLIPADSVQKPDILVIGISDTLDVASVICDLVNAVVNKKTLSGYLEIVPDLLPAISGIQNVPNEVLNMDETEFQQLCDHIKNKLKFNGPAHAIEEIAENLAVHVLGIIIQIIQFKKATDGASNVG